MDTEPAAAVGALHDPHAAAAGEAVVMNLGNMHLLAFHLRGRQVASLYEHHTGEVTPEQICTFTTTWRSGRSKTLPSLNRKATVPTTPIVRWFRAGSRRW